MASEKKNVYGYAWGTLSQYLSSVTRNSNSQNVPTVFFLSPSFPLQAFISMWKHKFLFYTTGVSFLRGSMYFSVSNRCDLWGESWEGSVEIVSVCRYDAYMISRSSTTTCFDTLDTPTPCVPIPHQRRYSLDQLQMNSFSYLHTVYSNHWGFLFIVYKCL